MAAEIVSTELRAEYGTDADTKVTHAIACMENLDPEQVSTAMDTIVQKGAFTDKYGNPLTSSVSARVRTITEDVLFE